MSAQLGRTTADRVPVNIKEGVYEQSCLNAHECTVKEIALNTLGTKLVSCSGGEIVCWDLSKTRSTERAVSQEKDSSVYLWKVMTEDKKESFRQIYFQNHNGRELIVLLLVQHKVTWPNVGLIRVFDSEGGNKINEITGDDLYLPQIAVIANRLFCLYQTKELVEHDPLSGKQLLKITLKPKILFSPFYHDSRYLMYPCEDREVVVFDGETNENYSLTCEDQVSCFYSVSEISNDLLAIGRGKVVSIINLKERQEIKKIKLENNCERLHWVSHRLFVGMALTRTCAIIDLGSNGKEELYWEINTINKPKQFTSSNDILCSVTICYPGPSSNKRVSELTFFDTKSNEIMKREKIKGVAISCVLFEKSLVIFTIDNTVVVRDYQPS